MSDKFAIGPNGQAIRLTPEQAAATQGTPGYTPIAEDNYVQQRQAQQSADYVDRNWGAAGKAAMGAASGLTLGLAPSLASKMGMLDRDHLEAAQESGAYMAGDVAGMVAPAILSGGESLAARGLAQGGARGLGKVALALTPAGLMGEAGGLAERLAGRFLGEAGIMGRLATPTIKMAARGATEGAINNLAHTVSDNVIRNKPLAAEALLASGVDGALFGGLAGGVLGGASAAAGAGIDLIGGRVAGMGAGRSADAAGAKVLRYLGEDGAGIARAADSKAGILERAAGRGDDGLVGTVRHLKDVLDRGEGSVGAGVANVRRAAQAAEEGYAAGIKDVTKTLQADHPNMVPTLPRVSVRLNTELGAMYGGTMDAAQVGGINKQLQKSLRNVKTWEGWTKTRESLAKQIDTLPEGVLKREVYKTALNAIDDEMVGESSALMAANPDLAKQYAANVVGKRQAEVFTKMTATKAVNPPPSPLNVHGAAGTIAYGAIAGANPVVGAGIIAAKQMVSKIQQGMAAPMAEAAYRSALGAKANMATINMGQRMTNGVKSFLRGAIPAATGKHAEAYSTSKTYSMDSYQKNLKLADDLTSAAHQAKVRETTDALAQQGHEEMAQQMAETYGRAVAYVQANRPKKGLEAHGAGKLGKIPKAMGLDTKDMKFQRIMHTVTNGPLAIIDSLERGDLSRDEVAAFQYVYPAAAADLNMRVAQELVQYRSEGNFVPVDKVAMLGTVLNFPVDSTLEPEFVQACQDGLAANKAPPPDQGSAPPSPTDITPFQTPLQSSMG